jgi:hypothetical protein
MLSLVQVLPLVVRMAFLVTPYDTNDVIVEAARTAYLLDHARFVTS